LELTIDILIVNGVILITSPLVQPEVDEALRLMRMSKHSLLEEGGGARTMDPVSAVYCAIRDHAQRNNKLSYTWSDLVALLGRDHTVRLPLSSSTFWARMWSSAT
jgi:hypothetical protein